MIFLSRQHSYVAIECAEKLVPAVVSIIKYFIVLILFFVFCSGGDGDEAI